MRLLMLAASAAILTLAFFSAEAQDDIVLMTAADLRERIVGNTMVGYYENGEDWREYFDPAGEIHGEDESHGLYTGHYRITENLMCFDYPEDGTDWCASMNISGDKLTFYKDGEKVTGLMNTTLITGNPYNL